MVSTLQKPPTGRKAWGSRVGAPTSPPAFTTARLGELPEAPVSGYNQAMKIYTKTGDDGDTGLFGGERVVKSDPRVDAYGSVDETNACLGVARSIGLPAPLDGILERIQSQLFVLGAELATPIAHRDRLRLPLLGALEVAELEGDIDRLEADLPRLQTFVLPAGSPGASSLHHARTVCRRAERGVVAIRELAHLRADVIIYLNRLSDLLFVMARHANHTANVPDVAWAPRSQPQPEG